MSPTAFALIAAAAGAHASWNFFAKQARGGLPFVWLAGLCAATAYALPAAIQVVLSDKHVTGAGIAFMAGSGCLHSAYFTTLQRDDLARLGLHPHEAGRTPWLEGPAEQRGVEAARRLDVVGVYRAVHDRWARHRRTVVRCGQHVVAPRVPPAPVPPRRPATMRVAGSMTERRQDAPASHT